MSSSLFAADFRGFYLTLCIRSFLLEAAKKAGVKDAKAVLDDEQVRCQRPPSPVPLPSPSTSLCRGVHPIITLAVMMLVAVAVVMMMMTVMIMVVIMMMMMLIITICRLLMRMCFPKDASPAGDGGDAAVWKRCLGRPDVCGTCSLPHPPTPSSPVPQSGHRATRMAMDAAIDDGNAADDGDDVMEMEMVMIIRRRRKMAVITRMGRPMTMAAMTMVMVAGFITI